MTLQEAILIVRAACHERAYVYKDVRAAEAIEVVCQSLVQPAPTGGPHGR